MFLGVMDPVGDLGGIDRPSRSSARSFSGPSLERMRRCFRAQSPRCRCQWLWVSPWTVLGEGKNSRFSADRAARLNFRTWTRMVIAGRVGVEGARTGGRVRVSGALDRGVARPRGSSQQLTGSMTTNTTDERGNASLPEQRAGSPGVHRPRDGQHDRVVHDLHHADRVVSRIPALRAGTARPSSSGGSGRRRNEREAIAGPGSAGGDPAIVCRPRTSPMAQPVRRAVAWTRG